MPPKPRKKGGGGGDDDDGGAAPSGTCNQVKVRHILCEKQSKVLLALREVQGYTKEDGTVVPPRPFNQVAMEYSEDKAKEVRCAVCVPQAAGLCLLGLKGGNLGWKRREELNGIFAEAAFKLAKGKARSV
jgi:NIMA-interacting peptidyl-prolyl cis-trans isomerase 4